MKYKAIEISTSGNRWRDTPRQRNIYLSELSFFDKLSNMSLSSISFERVEITRG
jgi:hypothetical protein